MQSTVASDGVTRALNSVRQMANRPAPLIDPIALIAALEHLADVARESNHRERAKYDAIFKQCRPLAQNPRLPSVVMRLLGDEEQKVVANQIQKILRTTTGPSSPVAPAYEGGYGQAWQPNVGPTFASRGRGRGRRSPMSTRGRCFTCRQFGHFAAQCNRRF